MSERKPPGGEPVYDHDEPEASAAEAQPQPQPSADEAENASSELQDELDAAREQVSQFKDQFVRARAELENVRKRAERDVESARKFALEKFAAELLGVRDSLELGLQAADEQAGDFDKLREGVDMTRKQLVKCMEQFGVEVIEAEGETFNPEMHEAMSMQPTDEHPPNTVVSVLQKGYSLNGRVLRPAMVVVSKAP
ncbi:MAG: nucleotide exchange factor GrpE [Salinisphaeraceae bacterium]|nr:nucleotide exchange factor GrpE [Salinisphaeraceae bacterium]